MKRVVFNLLILMILITECVPAIYHNKDCENDRDCKENQTCKNGRCVEKETGSNIECIEDSDCEDGFCNPATKVCVECYEDRDCGNGEICKDNQCQIRCVIDEDCGDSEICNNGACEKRPCCPEGCPDYYRCDTSEEICSCVEVKDVCKDEGKLCEYDGDCDFVCDISTGRCLCPECSIFLGDQCNYLCTMLYNGYCITGGACCL